MEIRIVSLTENPLEVISRAAGTSYGKNDFSPARAKTCFNRGHLSVFEHASFTVKIKGISRACSHQLVRHRLASFVQKSQRYCKVDTRSDDWYVIPKAFEDKPNGYKFRALMSVAAKNYVEAINDGIKPEDARYLLPEATKTEITMTMNVRELFTFLDLRLDKAAQWEIRELADHLKCVLWAHNSEWEKIIDLWDEAHGW